MNKIGHSLLLSLKNHYNHTESYSFYKTNTNQFESIAYTEPVKNIILYDIFTVGVLYYILHNL